jgi:hypothetical protein
MEERVCTKCGGDPQPIENFPWKNRLLGKRHAVCKTCTAERSKRLYSDDKQAQIDRVRVNNQRYRQTAREYVLEYLSSHPCSQCGESDPRVLEFHHLGNKDSEVSRLIGRGASLEALIAEIEKCVVLCANCHRRLTADESGWFKGRR